MSTIYKMGSSASALRVITVFLVIILVYTQLCSCAVKEEIGDYTVNTETVMKIGGYKVTHDEYRCFYLKAMDSLAAGDSDFWKKDDAPFDELKTMVERSLARKYAILTLVDEYDIELTDQDEDEINETVSAYIESLGGMAGYRQWLASDGYTGRIFREQYTLEYFYDVYLREVLLTGIDDLIKIDDKTVRDDIQENFYHYTWIFIPFDAGDNYLDNAKKINEAYEALEKGGDFYETAKKYSEWTGNASIGIYATKTEKAIEIEEAALALAEGEYSKVLALSEGHAILMRLPFDNEYINSNFDTFIIQSGTRRYHEYLDKMALEMKVKYTDYYDTLTMDILTSSKEYFVGSGQ